ncbi:MAG: glycosyltransferase family 4 protein, partial [Bryobacteraceae bacterium]
MHIRFITSTPLNFFQGSGTFAGIAALRAALESRGEIVELLAPDFPFPNYTLQRLIFNRRIAHRPLPPCDFTIGFDMDGYRLAGRTPGIYVASSKGVIADEMRFERGLTRLTMGIQAAREKQNLLRADFAITTSRYSAAKIQELYSLPRAPDIVPELISLAAWTSLLHRQEAASDPSRFKILTVGRFYQRKRFDVLLRAVARLRDAIPGLELRIVGGGPEAARLKSISRECGIETIVHWRENIPRDGLAREYAGCDVFCLPSVQEGFGIVFLEALAAGKPIVAVRAAAVPEVVRDGLLVPPDDPESLAAAIEKLYRDPSLRAALAES